MKLRPYQKEAVEAGVRLFKEGKKNGIIVLPTASGKSLVLSSITHKLHGSTLILQPNKEILEQNLEKFHRIGITPSVFSASCGKKDIGEITLATVGSVVNRLIEFDFDRVIIDECHSCDSKGGMYKKVIDHVGGSVLGLTATPFRNHSGGFQEQKSFVAKMLHRTRPRIFQEIIYTYPIKKMYEEGYLCPIKKFMTKGYNQKDIRLNSTGADFNEQSLRAYNEKIGLNNLIYEAIQQVKSKHYLVFVPFVEDAENIAKELSKKGIVSETVSAKTKKKDRERILEEFCSGEIKVVLNVGTMTTGFDFPELDCVILGRPTQSVSLHIQMVGRLVRIAEGKKFGNLVDIVGNTLKFGDFETLEFVGEKGKERLRSNKGFLTGYDFVNGWDLEEKRTSGNTVQFGSFKGRDFSELPMWYLDWGIENLNGKWLEDFKNEKKKRLT